MAIRGGAVFVDSEHMSNPFFSKFISNLTDNSFISNLANNTFGLAPTIYNPLSGSIFDGGGAVNFGPSASNVTISRNLFFNNSAQSYNGGGALSFAKSASNITINENTFTHNYAHSKTTGGGAVYLQASVRVYFSRNNFSANAAVHGVGGGMFLDSVQMVIINDSSLTNNTALVGAALALTMPQNIPER